MTKASEILRQAKAALPGHWAKGVFRNGDDRCGLGWVMYACDMQYTGDDFIGTYNALEEQASNYLHLATPDRLLPACMAGMCGDYEHEQNLAPDCPVQAAKLTNDGHVTARWFPWFNDADETTEADVLAAFDRAIALAEAEGN